MSGEPGMLSHQDEWNSRLSPYAPSDVLNSMWDRVRGMLSTNSYWPTADSRDHALEYARRH